MERKQLEVLISDSEGEGEEDDGESDPTSTSLPLEVHDDGQEVLPRIEENLEEALRRKIHEDFPREKSSNLQRMTLAQSSRPAGFSSSESTTGLGGGERQRREGDNNSSKRGEGIGVSSLLRPDPFQGLSAFRDFSFQCDSVAASGTATPSEINEREFWIHGSRLLASPSTSSIGDSATPLRSDMLEL